MLFIELALIRWAAAYVVYLAYFTNFVLLASFLGIGLGFLRPARRRDRSRGPRVAVAGFVAIFPVQVERDSARPRGSRPVRDVRAPDLDHAAA